MVYRRRLGHNISCSTHRSQRGCCIQNGTRAASTSERLNTASSMVVAPSLQPPCQCKFSHYGTLDGWNNSLMNRALLTALFCAVTTTAFAYTDDEMIACINRNIAALQANTPSEEQKARYA